MRNPLIARFDEIEDEFYSADGHVYITGPYKGPDGNPVALVPDHVGVDEPREDLGEFWVEEPAPGGDRFIARRFKPDELVITRFVTGGPGDNTDARESARRFFADAS